MSVYTPYRSEHEMLARQLAEATEKNNGMAPVDLKRFWDDQDIAIKNPFGPNIPQVPVGNLVEHPCIFDELGIPEDFWRYEHDGAWRLEVNKRFNDKAEEIVGRRLFPELTDEPARRYPSVKGLHDIFESRNEWHDQSWWLMPSAGNPAELEALLNRVEGRLNNLRDFLLPENWEEEKKRLVALGVPPPLYRGQRGPVTFATSLYGVENLLFLIMLNPDLAKRFSRLILQAMLGIAAVLDEEAGFTPEDAPHGFSFCDDNCCLLSPEMYEAFAYPILKGVFARYSPDPGDTRYQHSDSAMGHLLPLLGDLGLTGTNFGPTVKVADIRKHIPRAVIYGQLAPFTYSRNEHENIVLEFLRDFQMTREERGLVFCTAGSVNNGSRLTGMRLILDTVQQFGRYI
jgi:uroporphyrinogen decarboxylase